MRILITGSGGLLARSCAAVAQAAHEVSSLPSAELDVTRAEEVKRALGRLKADVVLHCAAYTDVDGAETDPARAMEVNAGGAECVARAAWEVGASMVYVSTDYIFDGEKAAPYVEADRPRPLSVYGASKLEGERRVFETCPGRSLVVRTAWLYGAGAGFVDRVCRGLATGSPVRLIVDHQGSPTYVMDLAQALLRLVEQGERGVFHFVNKGATTWHGLGRAIAELTGRGEARLEAVTWADLNRPARRPAYSVLSVEKYERITGQSVPSWRDGLKRYLAKAGRLPERAPEGEVGSCEF